MNSNMVKPETFGHVHLVYHFTIPLSHCFSHLEAKTIITQILNCVNISHGKLSVMHGTLKPFDN